MAILLNTSQGVMKLHGLKTREAFLGLVNIHNELSGQGGLSNGALAFHRSYAMIGPYDNSYKRLFFDAQHRLAVWEYDQPAAIGGLGGAGWLHSLAINPIQEYRPKGPNYIPQLHDTTNKKLEPYLVLYR